MGIIDAIIDWLARTFFGMKDAVTQPSQTQTPVQPAVGPAPVSNDIAAGAGSPTAGKTNADIPPTTQRWDMYKVVVEESGIPANQVKDISVSSDGKTLTVRLYDGTEKTIPSRAPWQVTNPEGRHYIVKVGMEQFQVVPGKPKQYPTVYDMGGYPDTAYGQIAPDGVYYDSFLDWCKRHYGTAPDPLGLKYRELHQEETGPALEKWSMEYVKVASTSTEPVSTAPQWQQDFIKAGSDEQHRLIAVYHAPESNDKYVWAVTQHDKQFHQSTAGQSSGVVGGSGGYAEYNVPSNCLQTRFIGLDANGNRQYETVKVC